MMDDKFSTQTKNNFLGTPQGILLAVIFFPFFFTWWVYKRNWNPKIKWAFMIGFWSLILIAEITNYPRKEILVTNQKDTTTNVQPASQAPEISISNTSPSPIITLTYPPFDKNHGNNFFSAKYAKEYIDLANKTAPGAIKDVYLKLLPEDPAGKTEEQYKKSVSETFLTVTINPFYWNITDTPTKNKLITAAINELKNTFSGYPHLIINNGTKTLATGELTSLNGEPKVTLK